MIETYKAHPEFIGRNDDTDKLYEKEHELSQQILSIAKWRTEHFKESFWTEALPQVLLNALNSFDPNASEVAAKSYLSKQEETKEVEK